MTATKPDDIPQWAWDLGDNLASMPPHEQLAILQQILDARPDTNPVLADELRRRLKRKLT